MKLNLDHYDSDEQVGEFIGQKLMAFRQFCADENINLLDTVLMCSMICAQTVDTICSQQDNTIILDIFDAFSAKIVRTAQELRKNQINGTEK